MKQRITMYSAQKVSIEERFEQFLSAAAASGFSEKTLKMYREHLHCISKHLDISQPLSILTRAQLESAVASMRKSGLSANSISSYMRAFKSFLSWCDRENYAHVVAPVYKQKDTVKETYTDDELRKLLKKPKTDCSFCEYRNWTRLWTGRIKILPPTSCPSAKGVRR